MKGTIRQIGLEGGVWALLTESGVQVELIDPPAALCVNGLRVEIEPEAEGPEVSVGMLGGLVRVKRYRVLDKADV